MHKGNFKKSNSTANISAIHNNINSNNNNQKGTKQSQSSKKNITKLHAKQSKNQYNKNTKQIVLTRQSI